MTQPTPSPRKLFYRIQEVAAILGVEAYVLRYWETRFPMVKPERFGNDERRYRQRDVEILLRIQRLLHHEKFTIAGAVEKLKQELAGEPMEQEGVYFRRPAALEDPLPERSADDSPAENLREQLAAIRRELQRMKEQLD